MWMIIHLSLQWYLYVKVWLFFSEYLVLNSTLCLQHTMQWKKSIVFCFYMLANQNVFFFTFLQKVGRNWWDSTSCHLSTHPELFTILPSLPSDTEIAATLVSSQLKKLGFGCFRQAVKLSISLWKSWFPWRSHQLWKEARRGSHGFIVSLMLYPKAGFAFLLGYPATKQWSSWEEKRKKVYTWKPKLMRSTSVLQMHLTLANGTACLFKGYEMYFVLSPLKKKMWILFICL